MFSLCVLSGTLAVWLIGDSNLAVEKLRSNSFCVYPTLYFMLAGVGSSSPGSLNWTSVK